MQLVSKNKYYGKTLDRENDQWIYLERYLNTLNVRVVRGSLRLAHEAQNQFE